VFSVNQLAERLGVSAACVYALVESKELAHYRIGMGRGTIRVSDEQLQAYLGSHEQKRPAKTPAVPVKLKHLSLD
jgi:excisionase family DNA binding protein